MTRHVIAPLDEIPPGTVRVATVAGREIGVFNVDGELYALRNRCPHQGGPLCAGRVLKEVESTGPGDVRYGPGVLVACPWHGWEFDLATGRSWFDPVRTRVRGYPAARATGRELVEGPYRAELYPVSVEREYVVVDIDAEAPNFDM